MFRFQGDTPDSLLDYLKSHWSHIRCRRKDLLLDTCYCSLVTVQKGYYGTIISVGICHGYFSRFSPRTLSFDGGFKFTFHFVTEYSFEAISRCHTSISLLTRFLLHFPNSESEAYFPWDSNAASVSILVLSMRHDVHYSLSWPVPFVGDFLYKGQLRSISSTSMCALKTSDYIQNTPEQIKFAGKDDEFYKRHYSNHNAYIQLNSSSCPKRRKTEQTFSVDAWLHTKFHLPFDVLLLRKRENPMSFFTTYQAIFIILLLSSPLFPSAHATRNNTTMTSHSFFSTSRPLVSLQPPSFCDQYSISLHLSDEKCSSEGCNPIDGLDCCSAIKNIEEEDDKARLEVEQFLNTMLKYATSQSYSIQWSAENCKAAYKNWICSEHHKYYDFDDSGIRRKKPPCLSICTTVESSCPFFRVHNKTKLYGGQPTFLCKGSQEDDCYNMNEIMPVAHFPQSLHSNSALLLLHSSTTWSYNQVNISRASNTEFNSLSRTTEVILTTSASSGSGSVSRVILALCYMFCMSTSLMHL